jgi:DNA-binding NtrC family response regulator
MMTYGKRVLVVDDEEQLGHLLVGYLEMHYFAAVAVADGRQALRELHRRRFDAVITDLQMPYLDGLDLLCRCHLVWPQLPVILLTGDSDDVTWVAMVHGAYACLSNPVDTKKLISVLSEAISDSVDLRSGQGDTITHMQAAQPVLVGVRDRCQAGELTEDEAC